jgi:FkbM family methyltransferase
LVDVTEHTTPDGVTLWVRALEYDDDRYSNDEVRTYDIGTVPPKTVLDVGSYIGPFTCWIKHLYPDAEVVAVEPEPGNYEVLLRNTANLPGVTALLARMNYAPGDVRLLIHPSHMTCHQIIPVNQVAHEQITIPAPRAVTIEEIMDLRGWDRISLMKIDCEGCEEDVLMNCSDETLLRIDRLTGEFHRGHDHFQSTIGNRLRSLGFEVTAETNPDAHSTFMADQNLLRLDFGDTLVTVDAKGTVTSVQFEIPEGTTIVSGETPVKTVQVKAERRPQPQAKATTRKTQQRPAATKGKAKKK